MQYLGDTAVGVVGDWLSDHGLNLAAEKTEAVLIARTKKRVYATFMVNDEKSKTREESPYMRGCRLKTTLGMQD